jgi:hypothetical protein
VLALRRSATSSVQRASTPSSMTRLLTSIGNSYKWKPTSSTLAETSSTTYSERSFPTTSDALHHLDDASEEVPHPVLSPDGTEDDSVRFDLLPLSSTQLLVCCYGKLRKDGYAPTRKTKEDVINVESIFILERQHSDFITEDVKATGGGTPRSSSSEDDDGWSLRNSLKPMGKWVSGRLSWG